MPAVRASGASRGRGRQIISGKANSWDADSIGQNTLANFENTLCKTMCKNRDVSQSKLLICLTWFIPSLSAMQ
jgi:hypothetical protein